MSKKPKRAVDQLFEGHGGATAESLRVAKDETRRTRREEFMARLPELMRGGMPRVMDMPVGPAPFPRGAGNARRPAR